MRISVALGAGVAGMGAVGSEDSFIAFVLRDLELLEDLGGLIVYLEVILVCHLFRWRDR